MNKVKPILEGKVFIEGKAMKQNTVHTLELQRGIKEMIRYTDPDTDLSLSIFSLNGCIYIRPLKSMIIRPNDNGVFIYPVEELS